MPGSPGRSASGRVETILSRRSYDLTNLAGSGTMDIIVVRAIDVSAWGDATLIVRAHALTIASGASFQLIVKSIAPCADDPAVDFLSSDVAATVTFDSSVTAPALRSSTLTSGFGSHVQIVLRATQASSPATLTAELSADLVTRVNVAPRCGRSDAILVSTLRL